MSQRVDKVKEALKEEISCILHDEINDPRIGFVTITRAEVTPDLRIAKVYYSVMEPNKKTKTGEGLKSATGYIRKLIGERLKLRFTPEISFVFDDSIEYSQHMSDLIRKAREKDEGIS